MIEGLHTVGKCLRQWTSRTGNSIDDILFQTTLAFLSFEAARMTACWNTLGRKFKAWHSTLFQLCEGASVTSWPPAGLKTFVESSFVPLETDFESLKKAVETFLRVSLPKLPSPLIAEGTPLADRVSDLRVSMDHWEKGSAFRTVVHKRAMVMNDILGTSLEDISIDALLHEFVKGKGLLADILQLRSIGIPEAVYGHPQVGIKFTHEESENVTVYESEMISAFIRDQKLHTPCRNLQSLFVFPAVAPMGIMYLESLEPLPLFSVSRKPTTIQSVC